MRKKLLFIVAILPFVLGSRNVLALDVKCTVEERLRLRELALATKITYEFYEDLNLDVRGFKVRISGFSPDFYIYNIENGTYFEYSGSSIVEEKLSYGTTYKLPFFASDDGVCKDYLILTKTIVLPNYNHYSNNPLCEGYETYELCKKFTPIKIDSRREFEQRMNEYIKRQKITEEEPKEEPKESEKTISDIIVAFLVGNYIIILYSIILIGTTIIIIIQIRKRRSIL